MKRLIVLLMLTGAAIPALAKGDWKGKVVDEKGETCIFFQYHKLLIRKKNTMIVSFC